VSGVGATTGTALVEVYDLTPTNQTGAVPSSSLYVAQLRLASSATGSSASGYATILVAPDGSATVNVTFTNLTSVQSAAHLQIGATSRDYVLNLPLGQVAGRPWTFTPSGASSTNDLINALNGGNIFVGLGSAKFPGGELRGNFVPATGSQTFVAPAAPPALSVTALANPTATDAAQSVKRESVKRGQAVRCSEQSVKRGQAVRCSEQQTRAGPLCRQASRTSNGLTPLTPFPIPARRLVPSARWPH